MSKVRNFQWGIALSVVAILLSFSAGMWMGTAEDAIRGGWEAAGQSVMATFYNNDPKSLEAMIDTAWTCLIRAHLHWGAIGAATLVMSSMLLRLKIPNWYKSIASIFMGLGAIIYPISWLYVANNLTVVGKAAKAGAHPIAVVGIGTLMVGTVAFFAALIFQNFKDTDSAQDYSKGIAK